MDIITLVTAAYTLSKPFLEKTAEGTARKIGEEIWNLIKKPFAKHNAENVEALAISNENDFKQQLQNYLVQDPTLSEQLEHLVSHSQMTLSGNFQQNINSYDKVEKQINIQSNSGNITM